MSRSALLLQCANSGCLHAENRLGARVCDRCQKPLVYRYLWVTGDGAAQIPPGTVVGQRYGVLKPQIWLDAKPALLPEGNEAIPDAAKAYLALFPYRLHLPVVYGACEFEGRSLLLLENVPLNERGQLLATVTAAWEQTPATRQVYWLWQMLDLWLPLQEAGVAATLLNPENLHVEGWRVRVRELLPTPENQPVTLAQLGHCWQAWAETANAAIAPALWQLCEQIQSSQDSEEDFQAIASRLNQILLEQAAQLPLRLKIVGATTAGPKRQHNEDACYPITIDKPTQTNDPLVPNLAIVCDGIGGHAGGEVASQMALRSLQLQVLALLAELAEQSEVTSVEVVQQQLEAIVRVVNNVIAEQNNLQEREFRQRMGTTLVMALQLPQPVATEAGAGNSHELYLVNVGDSRAYWLTPRYCHLLTVDDDVASREVRLGRSLRRHALHLPDAGALTQAVGTRDGETLQPWVQRFILEEDGVLLLCSDGLSDGDRVEQAWQHTTSLLAKNKMSLEEVARSWINLANSQNGHDNTSVVLVHCQVSPEYPQLFEPDEVPTSPPGEAVDEELPASSRALLYDEEPLPEPEPEAQAPVATPTPGSSRTFRLWAFTLGLAVIMFLVGAVGISIWRQNDPTSFQRTFERFFPQDASEE